MKQRAKELDVQKRAQRSAGSKFTGSSTGISSNMYNNSSTESKPDVTPTPVTYPTSTIRPSSTGKAMKLGTKGKNVDSFVDQLKSEGEIVANNVPMTSGAGGTKTKTQSISLPDTAKGE